MMGYHVQAFAKITGLSVKEFRREKGEGDS